MTFSAPSLIRLLARLNDGDAPAPARSLSDSLSQWLGWTDAIALSTALKGAAVPASGNSGGATQDFPGLLEREQREFDRVRASLVNAILGQGASSPAQNRPVRGAPAPRPRDLDIDFTIHRQRYMTLQHTMAQNIALLRARLRTTLAAQSPKLAQLAVMDALMAQVLDAREQSLLAGVPALLSGHFERLQAGEAADLAAPQPGKPLKPGNWISVFRKDMNSVLLAELDIRLHPAEGLMAALRAC